MDRNKLLEDIDKITKSKRYSNEEMMDIVREEGLEQANKVYSSKIIKDELLAKA